MIEVENLVHEYIRRDSEENVISIDKAVNRVSFHVDSGEFVAILGHNGSGKSTLAKHINGILQPTEGTIWIDRMSTADEKHLWEIRQSVGMVFQNPDNQIIHNVVEEDVGFGPENLGISTKTIWQRVEEALNKVGMWEYRKKSPNNLSGGQKQRVAIAGILAMRPKCIVLDEATAMLDPVGRQEVLDAVRGLNQEEGITVLWITHHMEEVVEADRILVMNEGEIALEGTPKEVFSQIERMRELHLDVPQVTLLAHELRRVGMQIPAGILSVDELVDVLSFILA